MSKYNHVQSLRRSPVSDLRGVQKLEWTKALRHWEKTVKLNSFISNKGEAGKWLVRGNTVCTCAAHWHLCQLCCSSQPKPALTDQSRHRERCNSRSRARRTVLATFGKLLRFFQKSLDLSLGAFKKKKVAKGVWKVAKSSDKVVKLATWTHPWWSFSHTQYISVMGVNPGGGQPSDGGGHVPKIF